MAVETVFHDSLHIVLAEVYLVEPVVLRQKWEDAVGGSGIDITDTCLGKEFHSGKEKSKK
jgi:hypothetical protein